MKTYAESQNKPPFDWNAELRKKIAENEHESDWDLEQLAENWVTCACGNQCAAIPRDEEGGHPLDRRLRELGMLFCDAIGYRDWLSAQATLAKIEARSTEILATL